MTCETFLLLLLTFTCTCIDITCCVISPHSSIVYFFLGLVFISIVAFVVSITTHIWFQPNYINALKIYSIIRIALDALILNGLAYLVTVHIEGEHLLTTQIWMLSGLILGSLLLHIFQIICVNRFMAKQESNADESERRKDNTGSNVPYGALP